MTLFRYLCLTVLDVDKSIQLSQPVPEIREPQATHGDATATHMLFDETIAPEGMEIDDCCKPPVVTMICTKTNCTCCK